jgi:hypothetical protein
MSCNICADTYNKSTRLCIKCPYCSFDVCRTCCETYILSETNPRCMHPDCYKEWSRKFLRDNFTLVFLTKRYRPHMENVLFDKEKALLPDAQLEVEENIRKKHVRERMKELDREMQILENRRRELEREYNGEKVKKERAEFVRQCPADGCRGFLSTQWKCGICELWTCPDCHELKGPSKDCEHTCDLSNLETARLLEKDSKPCPSCHSLIFKISGCNQMWCTMCNTAFCWATGRIEKTHIHNPHYFEWLRSNQNSYNTTGEYNLGNDLGCNRELTHQDWSTLEMIRKNKYPHKLVIGDLINYIIDTIYNFGHIIRYTIHLMRVEVHSFQVVDYVRDNRSLRVAYLEGIYTDEEFKTEIQRRDKKNRKNIEISQVLRFVGTAAKDIVFRFIDDLNKKEPTEFDAFRYNQEIKGLVEHSNELLKDISHTYNCVRYHFGENLQFVRGGV